MLNTSRMEIAKVVERYVGAGLWYEEAHAEAVVLWGAKANTFLSMCAALSQRRRVGDDVRHAHWALQNPDLPLSAVNLKGLSGAMGATLEAARVIREGIEVYPRGPKINAFARALCLDDTLEDAVCDVHVCRPLLGYDMPQNNSQRRWISDAFDAVGRLFWPYTGRAERVRRAQAAFWHHSATSSMRGVGQRSVEDLSYAALIRALPR